MIQPRFLKLTAVILAFFVTGAFAATSPTPSPSASPPPSPPILKKSSPSPTPTPGPSGVEMPPYRPNPGKAPKSLNMLILGGTGFIGPFEVRYALARGHKVTIFNRGKSHSADVPPGVEVLHGDRSTGDLKALKGRKWDVVIDDPTMLPKWVRDLGEVLGGNTDHYIFISTISVYDNGIKPGADESSAPIVKYEGKDAMKETRETVLASGLTLYGPLKALSEKEAEKSFPGKTCIIRPGLIVGPGDPTDRFTYWPARINFGGEVLAPGNPRDPVQFIDARDLAEWIIRMAEQGTTGTYNAVGPATPLTIGGLLEGIKAAVKSKAHFTWVPADFLEEAKVAPWSDMPVWIPPAGEGGAIATISNKRAIEAGLTFRPLEETARDTLEWYKAQSPLRRDKFRAGIPSIREAAVLNAWHKKQKDQPR